MQITERNEDARFSIAPRMSLRTLGKKETARSPSKFSSCQEGTPDKKLKCVSIVRGRISYDAEKQKSLM